MKTFTRRGFLGTALLSLTVPILGDAEYSGSITQAWNDFVRSLFGWDQNLRVVQDNVRHDINHPGTLSIQTVNSTRQANSTFKKLSSAWNRFRKQIC